MSASNFLVVSLGFSMYRVMSPVSSDSFTSYFSIWIPFFFSYQIAMASISKTMLNKSVESGHPCVFHHPKENIFSISPLSMMLAVGLSYTAFMMFPLCWHAGEFTSWFQGRVILLCMRSVHRL